MRRRRWRMHDPAAEDADAEFEVVKKKVLVRDRYTCRYCQMRTLKESTHLRPSPAPAPVQIGDTTLHLALCGGAPPPVVAPLQISNPPLHLPCCGASADQQPSPAPALLWRLCRSATLSCTCPVVVPVQISNPLLHLPCCGASADQQPSPAPALLWCLCRLATLPCTWRCVAAHPLKSWKRFSGLGPTPALPTM